MQIIIRKSCLHRILLLLVSVIILSCEDQETLAKFGDERISLIEYKAYLKNLKKKALSKTHEQRLQLLNRLIDQKLLAEEAYRAGIDRDPDIQQKVKLYYRGILRDYVKEKEIYGKAITKERVEEGYQLLSKQVTCKYILLKFPPNASEEQIDSVKQIAAKIAKEYQAGMPVTQLVKEYSTPNYHADEFGNIGINWLIPVFTPEIHRVIVDLRAGELSEPIRTNNAIHLFWAEKVETIPPPLLKSMERRIRNRFEKIFSKEIAARHDEFLKTLSQKYDVDFESLKINLTTRTEFFVEWGEEVGYDKDQEIQLRKKLYLEKLMLDPFAKKLTKEPTPEDCKREYNKNPEKYSRKGWFKIQEILVNDLTIAENLYKSAKNGADFEKLMRENSAGLRRNRGKNVTSITENQRDRIGKTVASMTVGEISKPIEFRGKYSIIKLIDKIPERQLMFKEVKMGIKYKLRKTRFDSIKTNWFKNARESVQITIYEDHLKSAFN